jgi:hypothetical protein
LFFGSLFRDGTPRCPDPALGAVLSSGGRQNEFDSGCIDPSTALESRAYELKIVPPMFPYGDGSVRRARRGRIESHVRSRAVSWLSPDHFIAWPNA